MIEFSFYEQLRVKPLLNKERVIVLKEGRVLRHEKGSICLHGEYV
jgi:hypothetical protein